MSLASKPLVCALFLAAFAGSALADAALPPPFDHVFVILEENKDFEQILAGPSAPTLQRLAHDYGQASAFYGEVHPSEGNYVALLGGDTFGIHDDDAYYCRPLMHDPYCGGAQASGYQSHTVPSPHLGDQLAAKGLAWKGYYEDLPAPGSGAVTAGEAILADGSRPAALYASKHSGFMNFASVQTDPARKDKIVGFDQLERDLRRNALPNFALIVPNQCNEMHGLPGPGLPEGCASGDVQGLIRRGDAEIAALVGKIMATDAWRSAKNVAIVITFDEGASGSVGGCCGVTPGQPSNFGGGHIPTIVVTNHGPRGVVDPTPYNHYSLLRTIEDAFGLKEHLGRAAATQEGVKDMTPLFRETPKP